MHIMCTRKEMDRNYRSIAPYIIINCLIQYGYQLNITSPRFLMETLKYCERNPIHFAVNNVHELTIVRYL